MASIARIITVLALALCCQVFADNDAAANSGDNIKYLPVSQVPERVMATVKKRKPNIYVTSASKQLWANDHTYYVVYGSQVSRFWVVTVRADGTLIRIDEEGEPRQRAP
jgi:hypothetical protein